MVIGLFELLRNGLVSHIIKFNRVLKYSTLVSPAPGRKWSFFNDGCEKGSSVYENKLKFQRPTSIEYSPELENSMSLIGTVICPLKRVNRSDKFGVHTQLIVNSSSQPDRHFRILLKMWNEMAEYALNYLKEDDFIYVRGHLNSYMKKFDDGNCRTLYEVKVKEINYVTPKIVGHTFKEKENLTSSGEDYLDRRRNRLHLWQVFFADPYEWIDLRQSKKNPKQPDFKHKSTGEALWLSSSDPPWLKRQLQWLDSVMAGQSPAEFSRYTVDRFW